MGGKNTGDRLARGEQSATFAMPSSGTGEAIQKDGVTYYTPPKAKVWAHCRCGYAASSADDFSAHFHEVHCEMNDCVAKRG